MWGLQHSSRSPVSMSKFLHTNNLFDVWRCHHPMEHDYTFFSATHNSYSFIDYFFVDKWLLQKKAALSFTLSPGQTMLSFAYLLVWTPILPSQKKHPLMLQTFISSWKNSSNLMWDLSKNLQTCEMRIRRLLGLYLYKWALKLKKKEDPVSWPPTLFH